jgi:hypothetical protein
MSLVTGDDIFVPFSINQTDLLAGTSAEIVAPVKGFVKGATVIVQTAVGTGGDITVKIADTAVTGLTLTVADSATKGTVVTDEATVGAPADREVDKNERIQVVPAAAFATSGAVNGFVIINTGK